MAIRNILNSPHDGRTREAFLREIAIDSLRRDADTNSERGGGLIMFGEVCFEFHKPIITKFVRKGQGQIHRTGAGPVHQSGEICGMDDLSDTLSRAAGELLKRERLLRGMSQEKLASIAETSVQQISRLEAGSRKFDDLWKVRLANALNIPAWKLIPDAILPRHLINEPVNDTAKVSLLRYWDVLTEAQQGSLLQLLTVWSAAQPPIREDDDISHVAPQART